MKHLNFFFVSFLSIMAQESTPATISPAIAQKISMSDEPEVMFAGKTLHTAQQEIIHNNVHVQRSSLLLRIVTCGLWGKRKDRNSSLSNNVSLSNVSIASYNDLHYP